MDVRILHCGTSIRNYNLCINQKVAGFIIRGQNSGDLVYFSVKVNDKLLIGARGVLDEETDFKPWPDAERYKSSFVVKDFEFCKPFEISILKKVGGGKWYLKFVQVAKTIFNKDAIALLNDSFSKNKTDKFHEYTSNFIEDDSDSPMDDVEVEEQISAENVEEAIREIPDLKVSIMATFQTINFANESDKFRGIEVLVNNYFYSLFPQYREQKSLLISENRLFKTAMLNSKDNLRITGISGTPDALLIVFDKNSRTPFQINLIEYECYGEGKVRNQEKSNYFNGHIIPQLMRFASTFSIVTEKQIREDTIDRWSEKIISYIYEDNEIQKKVTEWITEVDQKINPQLIGLKLKEMIIDGLKFNLKIMLIIDDLSIEQKDTLSNVIRAFKLENNESIQFMTYIVRLEQRIKEVQDSAEFALSVQ